jgi:hypothetical protein
MNALPQAITHNPQTNLLNIYIYIYIYIQIANKMGFRQQKNFPSIRHRLHKNVAFAFLLRGVFCCRGNDLARRGLAIKSRIHIETYTLTGKVYEVSEYIYIYIYRMQIKWDFDNNKNFPSIRHRLHGKRCFQHFCYVCALLPW